MWNMIIITFLMMLGCSVAFVVLFIKGYKGSGVMFLFLYLMSWTLFFTCVIAEYNIDLIL